MEYFQISNSLSIPEYINEFELNCQAGTPAGKRELGIMVSIGVSWNKIFAKLGSDYKKPDAITCIKRENWQQIVHPLSVGDLLYVGLSTQRS